MNSMDHDLHAHLRRVVYCLLIVTSTATMVGRILSVKSKDGTTAMLSANDRSRWSTIRALVDLGTYRLDQVIFTADGRRDPNWYTIDLVRHRGRDGREHYYSSKPPLLPTLLAAEYATLKALTRATLAERPLYIARLMLLTINVLPLVGYFVLLACLAERVGTTDWGRLYVMAAATWGTFLTTFAVTLNNHLPAAISVMIALAAAFPIARAGRRQWGYFAVAGLFAAFAVANELPALSFFAMLAAGLFWLAPRQTLFVFVPAAAVVAMAFFATNYVAHGSWKPPYAHRGAGSLVATINDTWENENSLQQVKTSILSQLRAAGIEVSDEATISPSRRAGRWVLRDPERKVRYALLPLDDRVEVRQWDDWYEYEGSYWFPERKRGVDRGERSRVVYAFHVLVGHRGIFSLTPIWLLSAWGTGIWLIRGDRLRRGFACLVIALTIVCLAFYLSRPLADRNYGGLATGFRWMFWFIPLWLICLLPAADRVATQTWTRRVAWGLLGLSVMSASYANLNPWTHSWIYDYWTYLGWLHY